jgi:hypothetical protein
MTATALEREELLQIVRNLSDDKLAAILKFAKDVLAADKSDEPNEETIKVLEDIEAGRNLLGPYLSLEAMFEDFGIDVDSRT